MQSDALPSRVTHRWAQGATGTYVQDVPALASGLPSGRASYELGFPPVTALPIASGGVPPDIRDMNGILRLVSDWARWVAAGGPVTFDATFATAIGGYPKGTILAAAALDGTYWFNSAENNLTNPDGGSPADWTAVNYLLPSLLPVTKGGTGLNTVPSNGKLLIGNGTGYSSNTLSEGAGVGITNTSGNITLAAKLSAGKGIGITNTSGTLDLFAIGAILAWARFDGSSGSIIASNNVSGIVRNSVGNYTLVPTVAFPDANYGVMGSVRYASDAQSNANVLREGNTHSTTAAGFVTSSTDFATSTLADFPYVNVAILR